jgi:FKBP-type peptidyl-prolyl cis-trans isomerase FkpA
LTPAGYAAPEDDKVFYYLGTAISRSLDGLQLSERESALVLEGLTESLAGKAEPMDDSVYGPKIQRLGQQRAAVAAQLELGESQAYVDRMAEEKGAIRTASGLVYQEIQPGTGAQPEAASTVRAHYHGTLRDGSVFDSSRQRDEPLTIGLNQVIPCWTEGIAMMKVGGKAKLTCPANIAYGPQGQGGIPGNAALTFEVELLEVVR